jgi:DNA-binding transcriptional MerR regulator
MPPLQGDEPATLTIGAVAERTGLGLAVLRAWEARYGFPRPGRTPTGQRRYRERDVDALLRVVADRAAGLSLEAAIDRARPAPDEAGPSLFAALRRHHPELPVHLLSTRAMLAVSRAIEDECCARAERPVLVAAFQEVRHYRAAEARWRELARTAAAAVVFADFPAGRLHAPAGGPVEVPLGREAPLRREWTVVCDAPGSAAVLAGWEHPRAPGAARRFEAMWCADPVAVRRAARAGLSLALAADAGPGTAVARAVPAPAAMPPVVLDAPGALARATALTNRIVAYLDGDGSAGAGVRRPRRRP